METKRTERQRSALFVAAAAAPPLFCAGISGFRESVTAATAALVLVLIVIAVAATGDRFAGIVAAMSAGAWFDFFLTEPYGRFTINDPSDIEVAVLLVLVGVAVTEITLLGRRHEARASRRAGYLDGVLGTSRIIAGQETSPSALTNHVAHQIIQVLDIDECRFVLGPGPGPQAATLNHDGQVTRRGHRVNVQDDGLPTDDQIGLVVRHGEAVHGQFVLTSATRVVRPSVEQLRVAVLLADQVGAALARAN